jgi:hypothetical protein
MGPLSRARADSWRAGRSAAPRSRRPRSRCGHAISVRRGVSCPHWTSCTTGRGSAHRDIARRLCHGGRSGFGPSRVCNRAVGCVMPITRSRVAELRVERSRSEREPIGQARLRHGRRHPRRREGPTTLSCVRQTRGGRGKSSREAQGERQRASAPARPARGRLPPAASGPRPLRRLNAPLRREGSLHSRSGIAGVFIDTTARVR